MKTFTGIKLLFIAMLFVGICVFPACEMNGINGMINAVNLPVNLRSGLVGEYLFTGNVNDTSGNGNHGFVSGATLTTDRKGSTNAAYIFDGNDYISFSMGLLDNFGTGSFSISIWMRCTTFGGTLFDFQGGSQAFQSQLNTTYTWFRTQSSSDAGQGLYYLANLVDSSWHHFVFVRDASGRRTYLDGMLAASDFYADDDLNGYIITYIGAENGAGTNFFGKLDDFRIYNRALNIAEINALYHE